MKRPMLILLSALISLCAQANGCYAGDNWEKQLKQEVKKLEKAGWKPMPGGKDLRLQMEEVFDLQIAEADGDDRYVIGTASAKGDNINTATKQAEAMARAQVAQQLQTEIEACIKQAIETSTLTADEGQQVTTLMSTNRSKVRQRLGRTRSVLTAYRQQGDKIEVMVQVALDTRQARKDVTSLFDQLGTDLKAKMDKVLHIAGD